MSDDARPRLKNVLPTVNKVSFRMFQFVNNIPVNQNEDFSKEEKINTFNQSYKEP
jgi:hypothetical protein